MILVCEGRAEERHDPVTHRALEVGEEHGDLLALAFEGALGGEDLLREMLRRVLLGRDVPRIDGRADRLAAFKAEARIGRQCC